VRLGEQADRGRAAVALLAGRGALPTGAAAAFRLTFWSLTAATLAALVGAAWLVREQRRAASKEEKPS
jgi:hypothetical protein